MLRVGLTGGIACGKSHVLTRLAEAGCHTVDLDRLAHETMAPGQPAHAEIIASFGPEVLRADGAIDRKALGARVFSDAASRQRLNDIVHPRVRAEEARRVMAWAAEPDAVVVTDAALLVESGVHLRFDRLVVVHCSREEQLERLLRRDGIAREEATARLAAQMSLAEKRRFGHIEVDTSGSPADTDAAAGRLAEELRRLARSRPPRVPVVRDRAVGCLVAGPSSGPGGLGVRAFLEGVVSSGGVEMAAVTRAMGRDPARPWYEPEPSAAHPASFAGPLVLYALARGGADEDFLASAGASLGRLTQTQGEVVADTCLFVLALAALARGRGLAELPALAGSLRPLAERWGGSAPSADLEALLAGAAAHPPPSALSGPLLPLLGTLRGMAFGARGALPDARLLAALEALERLS